MSKCAHSVCFEMSFLQLIIRANYACLLAQRLKNENTSERFLEHFTRLITDNCHFVQITAHRLNTLLLKNSMYLISFHLCYKHWWHIYLLLNVHNSNFNLFNLEEICNARITLFYHHQTGLHFFFILYSVFIIRISTLSVEITNA